MNAPLETLPLHTRPEARLGASPHGFDDGYTFVICSRIDILTAEPYIDALAARGVRLHVACTERIADAIRERFVNQVGEPILLDDLSRATRWTRFAHNLLCILLEGTSPSRNIRKQFLKHRAPTSLKIRVALAVSHLFPKLSSHALNERLRRWLGPWLDNPFPTRRVIAVSHVTTPHLLCARNLEVTTLNESWDHAGGKCAGYPSRVVIAWNEDIGRDWQRFQGADVILAGFPVKLAYAYESPVHPDSGAARVALYAVGTCATEFDWYTEELRLMEAICTATSDAGWSLIIKPRPAGPQPGLPDFAERHRHVRLGRATSTMGTRDYDLDADYNQTRLQEMRSCSLVINTITTFCLDAACAGVPVLQIDLRGSSEYPALSKAQDNYHLSRYLLNDNSLCLRPAGTETIARSLSEFLRAPDQRAITFRDRVRSWIVPDVSTAQRISAVVDRLAADLVDETYRCAGRT